MIETMIGANALYDTDDENGDVSTTSVGEDSRLNTEWGWNTPSRDGVSPTESIVDDEDRDGDPYQDDPALSDSDNPDGYQPDEGRDLSDVFDDITTGEGSDTDDGTESGEDSRLNTEWGWNTPARDGVSPTESIDDSGETPSEDPALSDSPGAGSVPVLFQSGSGGMNTVLLAVVVIVGVGAAVAASQS